MLLAARLRLVGRSSAAAAVSKPTPGALRAAAASQGASSAWGGGPGGRCGGGHRRRRLHSAAAARQEQLASQPRDNEDASPTLDFGIAEGHNPLFWPYVVRAAGGPWSIAT